MHMSELFGTMKLPRECVHPEAKRWIESKLVMAKNEHFIYSPNEIRWCIGSCVTTMLMTLKSNKSL